MTMEENGKFNVKKESCDGDRQEGFQNGSQFQSYPKENLVSASTSPHWTCVLCIEPPPPPSYYRTNTTVCSYDENHNQNGSEEGGYILQYGDSTRVCTVCSVYHFYLLTVWVTTYLQCHGHWTVRVNTVTSNKASLCPLSFFVN